MTQWLLTNPTGFIYLLLFILILKAISAIVVAAIATKAGEWFPYDRYDR